MKIAFVIDDSLDKSDGVQQYVLTLGKWLRGQGHEVHYLAGHTQRTDIPHIHSLSRNLQVHFNQNRMSTPLPASRRIIKALLANENFDVLHVQLPHSPFLAGRIVKLAPASTVVVGTFHIIPFSKVENLATRLLGIALSKNLSRFDHFFSVSKPAADFARRSFRIRSQLLPNAVDVSFFHSAHEVTKYNDGLINIVFLGRLVERKGCMQLLEALEVLRSRQQLDGVRVLICGKGPLRTRLERYVQTHHLSRSVRFIGFVSENDKARYLKTAHIAVMPSLGGESFGIVLIEAMAAANPVVIAGNNIGYRSVLGERKNQLVDPLDTLEFANTLHHFIVNARARRQSTRWQAQSLHKYDVRNVGATLEDTYQSLHKKHNMR